MTASNLPRAYINGLALWTPEHGVPQFVARDPRLLRGTSLATQMALAVAQAAGQQAGFDLQQCAAVFGSPSGEFEIAIEQLDMMRSGDGQVSPAKFKNSVHNTASGIFSVAHQNKNFTTALAAGGHTCASVLLEAIGLLATGQKEVLAIVSEDATPEPFRSQCADSVQTPMAVAFALVSKPSSNTMAVIRDLAINDSHTLNMPPQMHVLSPALCLLEAVMQKKWGIYSLNVGQGQNWCANIEPVSTAVAVAAAGEGSRS